MPSVRPKLVEIGTPITGADDDDDDNHDTMGSSSLGTADRHNSNTSNRFVIGGPEPTPTPTSTATIISGSSLSKKIGGGTPRGKKTASYTIGGSGDQDHSMIDASSNSTTSTTQKRSSLSSSLARASTGKFISNKTKPSQASARRVSHSYVVGGGDEKKMSDSPMMMEEDTATSSPKPRTSVTETSFQIGGKADSTDDHNEDDGMELDHPPPKPPPATTTPSSYIIGGPQIPPNISQEHQDDNDGVEKMTGVVDLSIKPPVVVLDGANLAYAYDKAWQGNDSSSLVTSQRRPEPNARGIVVACQYFLTAGIRVLAVVPATMLHREPHQSILAPLEQKGILVPAPPRDDDDAYAITIARREDKKAMQRGTGEDGPGYVMSNDQFRDACQREEEEDATAGYAMSSPSLREWLTEGTVRDTGKTGPGRISFTFCDTGSLDDHGDKILDIVPNPRHPMVQFIEKQQHHQQH